MPKANRRTAGQQPVRPTPPAPGSAGLLVGLIAAGLLVRVVLAAGTLGTNDAALFWNFGHLVGGHGLFEAYRQNPELNHPPIPALWATAAVRLTRLAGGDLHLFCAVFKIPMLLAEAGSTYLLWRIGSGRPGDRRGLRVAALYAWALAPILVSGYHGNTDPVYAFLSLLAVYLLADRRRPLLAGLALGAAINVKLVPVLLIPPLLLSLRSRREAAAFVGGLAACALPFVPVFAAVGPDFYRNALAYNPKPDRWGLMLPLLWGRELPLDPARDQSVLMYKAYGRYLILGLVAGGSLAARLRGGAGGDAGGGAGTGGSAGANLYELAAAAYAVFLVFAPGFGPQYVAVVAPLLLAARPAVGFAYATLAGLCIGLLYHSSLDGGFPPGSVILGYVPHDAAVLGLAAWGVLAGYLAFAARRTVRAAL